MTKRERMERSLRNVAEQIPLEDFLAPLLPFLGDAALIHVPERFGVDYRDTKDLCVVVSVRKVYEEREYPGQPPSNRVYSYSATSVCGTVSMHSLAYIGTRDEAMDEVRRYYPKAIFQRRSTKEL